MASLSTLQDRLEKLDVAIASGVLSVRTGDTQTTFKSTAEMLKARDLLVKQIASAQGVGRGGPRYLYQSGKGL